MGILDQVASSASNTLVLIACARTLSADQFGVLSVAWVCMTASIAISRGYLGVPLTYLPPGGIQLRTGAGYAFTVAVAVGIVFGFAGSFVSWVLGLPLTVVVLSGILPIILTQDLGRFFAVSMGRVRVALVADAIWMLGSILLLLGTFLLKGVQAWTLLLLLGAFGLGSLVVIQSFCVMRPRLRGVLTWTRNDAHRSAFTVEALLGSTGTFVQTAIVMALLGPSAVAALRGSATIFGPLSLIVSAIPLALVPEMRRSTLSSLESYRRIFPAGVLMATSSLALGGIFSWFGASLGPLVLGRSWSFAAPIVLVTAVEYAAQSLLAVGNASLRASRASRSVLTLRIVLTVGSIAAVSLASLVTGHVFAVAVGIAVVVWGTALLGWRFARLSGAEAVSA